MDEIDGIGGYIVPEPIAKELDWIKENDIAIIMRNWITGEVHYYQRDFIEVVRTSS